MLMTTETETNAREQIRALLSDRGAGMAAERPDKVVVSRPGLN
jgi:hypothetical protein